MKNKTITFGQLTLPFEVKDNTWKLHMAKSQTQVKSSEQLRILTEADGAFVPLEAEEDQDTFYFSYQVNPDNKKWQDILKLPRNDKLRLLCNTAKLEKYLSTRITFFLHPENIVYDDNLMPTVIYRGIRDLMPPYRMNEKEFHKQLQCLAVALFSKKYNFDQLYNGSLKNAQDTEFERAVNDTKNLAELINLLQNSYRMEQNKTEKEMQLVPVKRFALFKRLTWIMIAVSVLFALPLIYLAFEKLPFQEDLLTAHGHYLASDYNGVITTLEKENPERLPNETKYILASSYIQVESLSDEEKEVILKNVSLKSEPDYLLYWIYNGRGEFDESIDKAKFLDDPTLVMYGLIKKIEQTKNNPDLEGKERDEQLEELTAELEQYREEYVETDEEEETWTEEALETEVGSEETEKVKNEADRENNDKKKNTKKEKDKDD